MKQKQPIKLSEKVAHRLYELIVEEHRYAPMEKLPNESDLSTLLGVSRPTLREAVALLVSQGVLQIQRGKGTFVVEALPSNGLDLSALSNLQAKERVRDLYEMRLIFEPAVVALACQRATDEELSIIAGKGNATTSLAKTGGDWAASERAFHWAIVKASRNEYMKKLYPIIHSAMEEMLDITPDKSEMLDITIADNQTILEFLLQRDEVGASQAMSIHIRHMMNMLKRHKNASQ